MTHKYDSLKFFVFENQKFRDPAHYAPSQTDNNIQIIYRYGQLHGQHNINYLWDNSFDGARYKPLTCFNVVDCNQVKRDKKKKF